MEKRQYGEFTTLETRADAHDAVDASRVPSALSTSNS